MKFLKLALTFFVTAGCLVQALIRIDQINETRPVEWLIFSGVCYITYLLEEKEHEKA